MSKEQKNQQKSRLGPKKHLFSNDDWGKKTLQIGQKCHFDLVSIPIDDLLSKLERLPRRSPPALLVTLNPEFVIKCVTDPDFYRLVVGAELVVPDGVGLIWAQSIVNVKKGPKRVIKSLAVGSQILAGHGPEKRIAGVDVAEGLVVRAAQTGRSVYFLGAGPGVAQRALATWCKRFPDLKGWAECGPIDLHHTSESEFRKVAKRVETKKPDYLFVAFGMGTQEEFVRKYLGEVETRVAIGVGGTFDYWANEVNRAPVSWRSRGGEWLYRLITQPRRWRRQLNLLRFVWLVLKS